MTTRKPSPATLAARALRAIPSEARSEQSRSNGRKGGRPGRAHIAVIQPSLSVGEPGWENSGTVISRHRTVESAQAAIDRAHSALRRQPGAGQSWYDWHIVRVEADGTRGPVEMRDDEDECPYCYMVGGEHTYACAQSRR